jgi:hypothetical protein
MASSRRAHPLDVLAHEKSRDRMHPLERGVPPE